jgi:MFS family permease
MLLVSGGFKVIGGVMTGTVSSASLFLLGRFIGCLGLGATVPLVTIYLSEIAPINIRGLVTASSLPVYGLSTLTACWVAY